MCKLKDKIIDGEYEPVKKEFIQLSFSGSVVGLLDYLEEKQNEL